MTGFTGSVTVGGGTLQIQPTAASGTQGGNLFTTAQNLVFANDSLTNNGFAGGKFELMTPSVTMTNDLIQTMGALTPTSGAGRIQVDSGNTAFNNILNFASLGTRGAGATLTFAPAASLAGIQFASAPAGSNGILSGYAIIVNPVNGAVDWVATPTANTNIAAFSGYTPLSTTPTTTTTNYILSGTVATAQADQVNSLKIMGGSSLGLGGAFTFTTNPGGLLFDNSAGTGSIQGAGTLGTTNQELVIITAGATPGNAFQIGVPSPTTPGALPRRAVACWFFTARTPTPAIPSSMKALSSFRAPWPIWEQSVLRATSPPFVRAPRWTSMTLALRE